MTIEAVCERLAISPFNGLLGLEPVAIEPQLILRNDKTLATTLTRVTTEQGREIAIGRAALKHMHDWTGGKQ